MADARKAELASFAGVPVTRVDPAGASGLSSIETVPVRENIVPNRCASPSRESVTVRRAVMCRAFEAELAAFDDGRVDQAVALEHVDSAFEPGDVPFNDVFGSGAATA